MMCLDQDPLVHVLFHFDLANPLVVLENPLVVFVGIGSGIFVPTGIDSITLFHWYCYYQKKSSIKVVDS